MVVLIVPQLQIGLNVSWKLWLNLWNIRWLNPSLSPVISFKTLELWQWEVLFAEGLMKPICVSWKVLLKMISYTGVKVVLFNCNRRKERIFKVVMLSIK